VRIKIKDSAWADILNIHYGASIGLVLALTIIAQGPGSPGGFTFAVANDPLSFCTFFLLIMYMFVDCITANARQGSHRENVIYMMTALLWIWFLGICTIYAKSPEATKFVLLPLYFVLSRSFQCVAYIFDFFEVRAEGKFALMLTTIIALLFSILMIPTCAIGWRLGSQFNSVTEVFYLNPNFIVFVLSAALLILKFMEIFWVAEPAASLSST
jgi:hypothetical protein